MTDFPGRPDHNDFWLMAECVQDLDAAADDGIAMERIIGKIDMDSLLYMATQRAMRGRGLHPETAMAASWVDGFTAGINFQKRRARQNPLFKPQG